MKPMASLCLAGVAAAAAIVPAQAVPNEASAVAVEPPAAGEAGGPGLALMARKVLTASFDGAGFVDNACVLVKDGKIVDIVPQRGFEVPEGYEVLDLGAHWLAPGMIELHCHVAMDGNELSETVFLTNPGMRSSVTVDAANRLLVNGMAGE